MGSNINKIIETPLGAVLILVITLVLAGLTVAAAISGQLTAAAVKLRRLSSNSVKCCWAFRNRVDHSYDQSFRQGVITS